MSLTSLPEGYRAVVFGAGGGIGAALAQALAGDPRVGEVFGGARNPDRVPAGVTPFAFDLKDEASIAAAAAQIGPPLHLVLVATGVLHDGAVQPEKTWRQLDPAAVAHAFAVNATGPALIAKHTLGLLDREAKSVFAALSARVGSIGDNALGGWLSYRASKAALHQIVRTLSIELARRNSGAAAICLHPGTVDTAFSKPFQSGVAEAKLFTPEFSAERLLAVVDRVTPTDSGKVFAWDGAEIPY